MTDIVERLRAFPPGDGEGGLFHDAADEIARLREFLESTRKVAVRFEADTERLRTEIGRLRAELRACIAIEHTRELLK